MTEELDAVSAVLKKKLGIDLGCYQQGETQYLLTEKLRDLAKEFPGQYQNLLRAEETEINLFLDWFTNNTSFFFRDPLVFANLEYRFLPMLIKRVEKNNRGDLRIWSAGCGLGEEIYSVAILLDKILPDEQKKNWNLSLFATDINSRNLELAQKGEYPVERLEHVPLGRLQKYFIKNNKEEIYTLSKKICEKVTFSYHDLTSAKHLTPSEAVFGSFDLIFCSNILLYFSNETRKVVLNRLQDALVPGGLLVLGSSEHLYWNPGSLIPVENGLKIFQRST